MPEPSRPATAADTLVGSAARQGIQSIEVGARLLQALVDADRSLGLTDLARAAGMSGAKAHRYLVSFIRIGLVAQDHDTGRYDLGPFALSLGMARLRRLDALTLARPVARALCDRLDQTIAVAVWGNHGPTIVQWLDSTHPASVNLRAGSVLPLMNSSTGRCFAAFLAPQVARRAIERAEADATPEQREAFARALDDVRAHGASRSIGELLPGIVSFSVPVLDAEGLPALVISVIGHEGRFDIGWDSAVLAEARAEAQRLGRSLGARGPR